MTALTELAREGAMAPLRIVMLPPAYATAGDFLEAGFARSVRERHLPG